MRDTMARLVGAALGEDGSEAAVLAVMRVSADTIKLALTTVRFGAHPAVRPRSLIIAEGWGEHLLGE